MPKPGILVANRKGYRSVTTAPAKSILSDQSAEKHKQLGDPWVSPRHFFIQLSYLVSKYFDRRITNNHLKFYPTKALCGGAWYYSNWSLLQSISWTTTPLARTDVCSLDSSPSWRARMENGCSLHYPIPYKLSYHYKFSFPKIRTYFSKLTLTWFFLTLLQMLTGWGQNYITNALCCITLIKGRFGLW